MPKSKETANKINIKNTYRSNYLNNLFNNRQNDSTLYG